MAKGDQFNTNINGGNVQGVGKISNTNFTQNNGENTKGETTPPWYKSHWIKSFGKGLLLAIPTWLIVDYINGRFPDYQLDFAKEVAAIVFCIASLFFINRDPKYRASRLAMTLVGLIGVVNILPILKTKVEWLQKPTEEGTFNFFFELGIDDNWYISVILGVLALFLFYKQKW